MPRIKFKNQIGRRGKRYYYRCAKGHDILLTAYSKDGIDAKKRDHERSHFDETVTVRSLGDCFDQWIARIERLELEGRRHQDTVLHYDRCKKFLFTFFSKDDSALRVARDRGQILGYIEHRLRNKERSRARCLKEIKALWTVLDFHGFTPTWRARHFIDEIRPVHVERPKRTMADVRELLEQLSPGSLEHTYVLVKALTGLRNVEIAQLTCGSLQGGHAPGESPYLRITRRSKRIEYADEVPIPLSLHETLQRWAEGRAENAPLLHLKGRILAESSLRKRLKRQTSVTSLGWIRHVVVSTVIEKADVYTAQRGVGHRSVTTTELYNIGDEVSRQRKHLEVLEAELTVAPQPQDTN